MYSLIFKLVFFVMRGVLMLFCVLLQDDSSAEPDDEEERVSLLLYSHFVSFIDWIFRSLLS